MNIYFLVMSLVTLSGVVAERRFRKSKERPVFDPSQLMRTFKMPKSCKEEGRQFCFDNDNYPIEIVEDLLKDATRLLLADKDTAVEVFGYADREGSPFNDECRATSNSGTIYYIVDEAGRDRVVVQLEGRFKQEVSVKSCDKEGPISGKTAHFLGKRVKHRKMYCQNKYMHYDFFVLSIKPGYDGKWTMERARTKMGIPVCCMCRYDKKN